MASHALKKPAFGAKQLVFACMLVVVVSILAFVVGVVVGRDSPQAAPAGARSPVPAVPGAEPEPPRLVIVGEPEEEPTAGVLEEVTYPDRLRSAGPVTENLRGLPLYAGGAPRRGPDPLPTAATVDEDPPVVDPVDTPEVAPPAAPEVTPADTPAVAPAEAAESAPADAPAVASANTPAVVEAPPPAAADPAGEAVPYTVQVAALRAADAAEEFAGRLLAKGYPAYVVEPAPDGPVSMYRVRVGRYADHDEAERVRRRLEQEEQLTPWITR